MRVLCMCMNLEYMMFISIVYLKMYLRKVTINDLKSNLNFWQMRLSTRVITKVIHVLSLMRVSENL